MNNNKWKVRKADGTIYGPADTETLRRWIGERRIVAEDMLSNADKEEWVQHCSAGYGIVYYILTQPSTETRPPGNNTTLEACPERSRRIRGARSARLPSLTCPPHGYGGRELLRKQAEQILRQAGELLTSLSLDGRGLG